MIGKGGNKVNRANREMSIRAGAQTPNNASSKPKRQNRRDSSVKSDNKSDHVSVYKYDGPEAQWDDVNSEDGIDITRNRQVSYYVNKEAMREMNNYDEDDYGQEISKKKSKAGNLGNQMHRDTYRRGGYSNNSDDDY
jgi:hypothetical protein